jgi:hypothetical protein
VSFSYWRPAEIPQNASRNQRELGGTDQRAAKKTKPALDAKLNDKLQTSSLREAVAKLTRCTSAMKAGRATKSNEMLRRKRPPTTAATSGPAAARGARAIGKTAAAAMKTGRRHRRHRAGPPASKQAKSNARNLAAATIAGLAAITLISSTIRGAHSAQPNESNLRFDAQTSSYQGLTFTFDPRLDKQVEQRLHFEHWLSIMQQSSSLLYESLNGRAHLAEIKVLIPFKWRQLSAELRPVLYKPGAPVITNRRLRFTDSDVIVGFEGKSSRTTMMPVARLGWASVPHTHTHKHKLAQSAWHIPRKAARLHYSG